MSEQPFIDPQQFRRVLGHYPTGVCVVTGQSEQHGPLAMVVGSFTSVSLDPPLVAFFPDRGSSSWAKLRSCEHFCVNMLSAEQEPVCRKLASKDPDKFSGTPHRLSPRGNPILAGTVGWIECDRYAISDAGDHEMVLGRVTEFATGEQTLPLLFFQGGYGRFAAASIGATETSGLSLAQLRLVDSARFALEALAADLRAQCIVTMPIPGGLAVAASAGRSRRGGAATLVGQRLPLAPPTGTVFLAWSADEKIDAWLKRHLRAERHDDARAAIRVVRTRGVSLGLRNEAQRAFAARLAAIADGDEHGPDLEDYLEKLAYDPADLTPELQKSIRSISAPVFDADETVVMALTLFDFGRPEARAGILDYMETVKAAAADVGSSIATARRPRTSGDE